MFAHWFHGSHLLVWPLVGLGIFFAAFLAVLLWVILGMRDERRLARLSSLPLEDDRGPHAAERRM